MKLDFNKETFDELQEVKSSNGRQAYTDKKNCKIAFCLRGFKSPIESDGTLKLSKVLEGVDVWCDDGAMLYMTKDGKSHLVVEADFGDSYDEFIKILTENDINKEDVDPKIQELDSVDMYVTTREDIYDIDLDSNESVVSDAPVIGKFKPKRKFLSFVSSVRGVKVRFLRDIAFIKGEKLSGVLEGAVFKVTICDEGTINFEEVDTNLSNDAMIQRLIDDIDGTDVTGYANKFIVSDLEFSDKDGGVCYLEVEHEKPISKLASLIDLFNDEKEATKNISDKGLSILDSLFGDDEVEEKTIEEVDVVEEEPVKEEVKSVSSSYLEESFRKMNEDKINELKSRIDDSTKDIKKYKQDISFAESKLKETSEKLGVLETRLETMTPGDEPNGYVFFVSEEQTSELDVLDDKTKEVADKIADLLKLKKDVLFKALTSSFYTIKIANKDNFEDKNINNDVAKKLYNLDVLGKLNTIEDGEIEYRGDLNWHQLVSKMLRLGFEQDPEFDKACNSNSYTVLNPNVSSIGENRPVVETTVSDATKDEKLNSINFRHKHVMTIDKPTNLVVVGTLNSDDNSDIQVTDDYYNYSLYIGGKRRNSRYGHECDGFISIMTITDYKKWYNRHFPDGSTDLGGVDSFLLPNFVGEIGFGVKLQHGLFNTDFSLNDFVLHQINDEDDDIDDVFLSLPDNTQIIDMKNHKLPIEVIRDLNLEKILN